MYEILFYSKGLHNSLCSSQAYLASLIRIKWCIGLVWDLCTGGKFFKTLRVIFRFKAALLSFLNDDMHFYFVLEPLQQNSEERGGRDLAVFKQDSLLAVPQDGSLKKKLEHQREKIQGQGRRQAKKEGKAKRLRRYLCEFWIHVSQAINSVVSDEITRWS